MAKAIRIVGTVVGAAVAIAGLITANPGLTALGAKIATYSNMAATAIDMVAPPKPNFGNGNPLQFQTNPQSGLPYPIGRTRMSGVRIHADTYDATAFKSEGKQDVIAFGVLLGAGGPMQEIETFRADKMTVTFDGAGNATGDNANYMAQKVSLGAPGASALALSFGGAGFPGWSSAHKLSGICHALWDLRYDEKGKHYGAGVPEPEWIGKWVKVYDPRKDSTYPGGSGSHRALNEATYEWSNNPALHALTWCLGRWQNGKRTLGIGAPIGSIRMADFVEAANVADANLWACGGVEWSTDSKGSTLKRMLQAGGAEVTMTGAMIGCRVNTPRVSIATIEAADLLDSLTIAASKSRRDRFNTVIPRFRSEQHEWEVVSGSPVSVAEYVAIDGGPRTKEIDFPLVQMEGNGTGHQQPGQLAAYEIVNSREAGPIRFTTGPRFFGIKTGDCVTLNVPGEGLVSQPVIIRGVSRDPATMKFTFEAETETGAKHDYAMGATTTPPPTWEPTPPDIAPPTPSPLIWSLENAFSDDGHPGIRIIGACEFPGADSVLIEYRKVGDPDWLTLAKSDAAQAVRQVVAPLDGDTAYEARLAYQSDNRVSEWLVLSSVTTPPAKLAGIDDGATRNVNRGDWASGTAYLAGDIVTYNGSSYQVTMAHISTGSAPPPNANVVLLAAAGSNVDTIWLYKRTATNVAPAVPDNDIVYSFTAAALSGSLDGWSRAEPPLTEGAFVWETFAHARSNDPTATIAAADWLNPAQLLRNDDFRAGTDLISMGIAADPDGNVLPDRLPVDTQLYLKTNATILLNDTIDTPGVTVALVSVPVGATVTINTAAGTPVAGKPKGFIRVSALPAGTTPVEIVVKAVKDGVNYPASFRIEKLIAAQPVRSQLVRLYKRTVANVAPALIDNNVTYTFADNSLTGSMDGWSQTEPPVTDGPYLWETWFFASAPASTLVITPANWHAAQKVRNDDYTATFSSTGWVVPTAADGSVNPAHLPLQSQLVFRTSAAILLSDIVDTAGVTVASVSTPSGAAATINTATNTPIAGKPKGYIRITALSAGNDIDAFVFKATKDGVDYPATITVTKAYRGEDGAEARGLRLIPNRDRLTRDAWGRLSPATQTFLFTPERENFTAGTVTYEVRNASNLIVGGAPTYGTVVGGNFQMTEAQVIAAAGTTRGVIVFIYDTGGGGKYGAAHIWTDGSLPSGDNEWPDPQLNTGDAYFAGGALAAPFQIFTIGATQGYKYNNYVRVVSTTAPSSEHYAKVAEKVPVRVAGETFWWGFTGGNGTGPGALGAGIYAIFRDVDGVQVGATQKLFSTTAITPTSDWPQKNGVVFAPADAAYVEFGWYRNNHGVISSTQAQLSNPYFQRSQPNANNTEANQLHLVFPAEEQIVSVSYNGTTVKSHPSSLGIKLFQGNTDITGQASWSLPISNNITAGRITIGAATGIISISPAASSIETFLGPAFVDVVATYANINVKRRLYFRYVYDFVPHGEGIVSDSLIPGRVEVSSTSFGTTPVIGPLRVKAIDGSIRINLAGLCRAKDNSGELEVRPEIRIADSGNAYWPLSFPASGTVVYDADNPRYGSLGVVLDISNFGSGPTAITPGVTYEIQFIARKSGTASAMIMEPGQYWVQP